MDNQYNTIEEALEDLRAGKIILVTDDEDRENEGDMICAAEFATQENINFMACHAKGLILSLIHILSNLVIRYISVLFVLSDAYENAAGSITRTG